MGDPLSIASAAVGILSFGISVCHRLLEYYHSWKDAEGDVAKMYLAIQRLAKTLILIKSTTEHKNFNRKIVSQIEESIESTDVGLMSLKKKLDKIKISSAQDGWKEKSKAQFRRALFPFKESTLVKLKELSNELRENLSLAIDVLQIDTSAVSLSKLDLMSNQMGDISDGVDYLKAHAVTNFSNIEDIKLSVDQASSGVDSIISVQNEEYISKIYEWLSPLSEEFQKKQSNTYNFRSRQDGTGKWLLATDEFTDWFSGRTKKLWCRGIPGGGKTVLASFVVNHLQQNVSHADTGVAYIYCDYKAKEKQILENLLASLLHQLLLHRPSYHERLIKLYKFHSAKQDRPSINDYAQLLQATVQSYNRIFFVIDALDECSETDGTRKELLGELQKLKPAVNILVTSRDLPSIERLLQDAARIEIRPSDEDIKNYVEDRISSSERISSYVKKSPDLRNRILRNVSEKANGMFLLARLHLDSLSTKTTLRKFKTTLESLPDDLNVTYDEIWERIKTQNPDDADLAKKVVYWVFHAMRPLTVPELQHALAVEPGDTSLDADSIPDEELMVSVCAGIVAVHGDSNTVGLVHSTTQEYLERKATEYFPEAQREIVRTCLTYLLFEEFGCGPCHSDQEVEKRLQERRLLQYASMHWGRHVTGGLEESEETQILEFLNDHPKMTCSLQVLKIRAHKFRNYTQLYPKKVSSLWLAAYFGLGRITKLLLERGVKDDTEDHFGTRPLEEAASRGHENVVRLLVCDKATPDINKAFHHAAWSGHEGVMRVLLENGADINAPNKLGMTALHLASQMGHENLTRFLLERGADLALTTDSGRIALFLAARGGHGAVSRVLLEHGRDYLYEAEAYMAALYTAYKNRHSSVIEILFEHMDRSIAIDQQGRNPLHLISATDQVGLVELLLEKGLDAQGLDKQKRTSLHHAAAGGCAEIVERLLREGLDPAQADVDHWTPFHWAARAGNDGIIKLLLVNPKKGDDDHVPGMMFRWEPPGSFGIDVVENVSQIEILMRIYDVLRGGGASKPEDVANDNNNDNNDNSSLRPSSSKPEDVASDDMANNSSSLRPSLFKTVISLKKNAKDVIDSFSHLDIQCDGCNLSIIAIRHTCTTCPDFDFCSKCILSSHTTHTHPQHHAFAPSAPFPGEWDLLLPPPPATASPVTSATATSSPNDQTPIPITSTNETTNIPNDPTSPTKTKREIPTQFPNPSERWTARDEENVQAQAVLLALFPGLEFFGG